jgi:Na+/proline symporter
MQYATAAALAAALILFVVVGLRARTQGTSLDEYITSRNSQTATTLGLSFLASGMGAWILFVPPEIGAFVGPVALAGYALGAALPFVVLVWFGPAIRRHMPQGRSLSEYAQARFGSGMRHWLSGMSVLYMLCFITAELTAIGAITVMLSDLPGNWVIVGLAVATLFYTAWGGLRASLATDRWQAWLLVALLVLVGVAALQHLPAGPLPQALPSAPPAVGLSVALTLIIAVTAANLFHQGYWQRIWAAESDQALQRGAWWGGVATVVVVAAVGGMGMLAVMAGKDLGTPPAPFFALVQGAGAWVALPVLLLALALVASSVDTLQSGLASLMSTYGAERSKHSLSAARWITVLLMVPVVLVALQGISVLRLFLIADLLCATAVVPVILGLWKRMSASAAIAGSLAGLVGAVLPGWVNSGSFAQGVWAASFPASVPTLAPFAGALLASTAVSVGWALISREARDNAGPRD